MFDPVGLTLAIAGAALAVIFGGIGSAKGIGISGRAACGVLAEQPEKFGSLLILVVLPGTQGFYGFLGAFLVMMRLGVISGQIPALTKLQGLQVMLACTPVGFAGLVSAIHQGLVCAAGVSLTAKRGDQAMKGVIYGVMVETYAVLGLLITILLLMGIKLG